MATALHVPLPADVSFSKLHPANRLAYPLPSEYGNRNKYIEVWLCS